MILKVFHVSTYRYDAPVRGVVQSHRLTPSVFDGQRTRFWQVTVEGGIRGGTFRDGAGDVVQAHSFRGPLSEISVQVEGEVETQDLAGLLRGHREVIPPDAYLGETAPTRPDEAIKTLAREAVGKAQDALDGAHRLAAAISDAIAYTPGSSETGTTAAEALARGAGVCQDHAHTLISAAHCLSMPARYVSGYLMADSDEAPNEATHAWAEIWIAGLGWVGFDPANRCCPDERFIRLGSGADAREAAPIRGVARGLGGEALDVTVAVRAVQQ